MCVCVCGGGMGVGVVNVLFFITVGGDQKSKIGIDGGRQ